MNMNTRPPEFPAMKFGEGVVTDGASVMNTQAPLLAGDHSRGYLASRQDLRSDCFDFRSEGGELEEMQHGVRGVFADS